MLDLLVVFFINAFQHSMYLEKAFSSRRLSSSQFGAKCTECDHREDSENMRLSLYKNYCSQLQENENPQDVSTNDKKLKVPELQQLIRNFIV